MEYLTLEDIKTRYYRGIEVAGEWRGFDQYLKDEFTPVYGEHLDFLGYDIT